MSTNDPNHPAYGYQPQPQQPQAYPQQPPAYYPAVPPQTQAYPQPYRPVQPHSAALAVIASFFIPGLGSMLNDRAGKGIAILISYLVSCLLCLVLIGFFTTPIIWIWGMVTANTDVRAWNRSHGIIS